MAKNKISVVINTYNAEELLEETLKTVTGFDEIVVCDMESTDRTIEISKKYGCKIVTFPKGNYNICEPARNTAIQSASNEWVLIVDADEKVTPELRQYLYSRIENGDCPEAIMIPRLNGLLDTYDKSNYPDYQCRFVRKDKTDWPPTIHSKPIINGRTERIPEKEERLALVHAPESMASCFLKMCRYTDNEVEKRKGKRITMGKMVMEPFFCFFKSYFLKGGIFRGKVGYIQAQKKCFYRFMVMCKLYERQLKNKK